jgi:putative DNA-invertase from lambdoid prophage Rac
MRPLAARFNIDYVIADNGVSRLSTRLAERAEGRRLFDILQAGDTLVDLRRRDQGPDAAGRARRADRVSTAQAQAEATKAAQKAGIEYAMAHGAKKTGERTSVGSRRTHGSSLARSKSCSGARRSASRRSPRTPA